MDGEVPVSEQHGVIQRSSLTFNIGRHEVIDRLREGEQSALVARTDGVVARRVQQLGSALGQFRNITGHDGPANIIT